MAILGTSNKANHKMATRNAFEKINMEGFRTPKVETLAMSSNGQRMFVGTGDGVLVAYDCHAMTGYSTRSFSCNILTTMRNLPKEKKPISMLTTAELWNVVVGIVDGIIMAFDINSLHLKSQIPETKGCNVFAIQESGFYLAVANKRKLTLYNWQQGLSAGFIARRELNLSESPKMLHCLAGIVIVGQKRSYEILDVQSYSSTKLMDVDKEHRMACLQLAATPLRAASVVLSLGVQGIVIESSKLTSGNVATITSTSASGAGIDRLEWSSPPLAILTVMPFIITLLADSIEIHDVATLVSLQRIPITGPSGTVFSMCSCSINLEGLEHGYVACGDQVLVLRMTPLSQQISTLTDQACYEDAINLCTLCAHASQLRDIDIPRIHEKFALALFNKGDFEGTISNYIAAKTSPTMVISLFPDLVPVGLHANVGITTAAKGAKKSMAGLVLQRAAASMVQFCEYHRPSVKALAELAERKQAGGPQAAAAEVVNILDPEETLRTAEIVDTVLLSSLVNCVPSRKSVVVDLLSSSNKCHLESCAVVLASQGNGYTEALLWLFRSHHEHKRVIAALTEERCVGNGAWTRDSFYTWTADYLRWLWYHEDSSLPILALNALKQVLEYDAELGLSVLTSRPKLKSSEYNNTTVVNSTGGYGQSSANVSFGGKGVKLKEVVTFLESVTPKSSTSSTKSSSIFRKPVVRASVAGGKGKAAAGMTIPLLTGRSLSVAYLEWLVNSGAAPSNMHDEYAQLLMEGVPFDNDAVHSSGDLDVKESDSESLMLYKIYRRKLQHFLQTSVEYHADVVMKILPEQFKHEHALLLARLGRHEEVLRVYVQVLKDMNLAEAYCDKLHRSSIDKAGSNSAKRPTGISSISSLGNLADQENAYLCLFRVLLKTLADDSTQYDVIMAQIVHIAERYHDRFEATAFLSLLPKKFPLAFFSRYLNTVIEYANTKKRNLQVLHQLLRVREVNLRTNSSVV